MAEQVGRCGVRKGAWSEQEDALLKQCIEMYGEGKWHQVPLKSGLNRCRKSCRLRWLNYLKPNIKRGEFSTDEADLMIRLHRLLGNRWSLIARRLPGRTANDVKNYWNTHLRKKTMFCLQVKNHPPKRTHAPEDHQTKVIRPRPRTFSNRLVHCMRQQRQQQQQQGQGPQPICANRENAVDDKWENVNNTSALVSIEDVDDQIQWWTSLLNDETDQFIQHEKSMAFGSFSSLDEQGYEIALAKDNSNDVVESVHELCMGYEESPTGHSELSFDMELWNFLSDKW